MVFGPSWATRPLDQSRKRILQKKGPDRAGGPPGRAMDAGDTVCRPAAVIEQRLKQRTASRLMKVAVTNDPPADHLELSEALRST